jgi:hypothetical protein
MRRRHQSPRTIRIVSALLAAVWLCAGTSALIVGAMDRRWFLILAGVAALWYGVIWARVARQGRQLTPREALMPWRLGQRSDT